MEELTSHRQIRGRQSCSHAQAPSSPSWVALASAVPPDRVSQAAERLFSSSWSFQGLPWPWGGEPPGRIFGERVHPSCQNNIMREREQTLIARPPKAVDWEFEQTNNSEFEPFETRPQIPWTQQTPPVRCQEPRLGTTRPCALGPGWCELKHMPSNKPNMRKEIPYTCLLHVTSELRLPVGAMRYLFTSSSFMEL